LKQIIKEKSMLFLVFLLFLIITEAITFRWVDFSILPRFLFIDLVIAFAFGSLIILIKSIKVSIIYLSSLLGFIMILFLINATMYTVNYDLFSFQQLQLIGEATTVFNFEHLSILSIIVATIEFTLYCVVMTIIYRIIKKNKTVIESYYPKALFLFASACVIAFALFTSDIPVFANYAEQNNITTFKRASLEKYGLLGYYTKEAEIIILREKEIPIIITTYTTTQPTIHTNDQTVTSSPTTYEVVTTDSTENNTQELFVPTDYFGLLEGKNVISIMLESIQPFAINEYLTPNLYNLTNLGLYFPASYSENKTNVSEMIAICGNYPTINFIPDKHEYDFSFSLPNILNETYSTSYFHDNVPEFYLRGSLMPQLGFENTYFHDDLYPDEAIWTWNGDYTLDSVTIEKILPEMLNSEQPFYSFWSTLSTHGPYNYGHENIALFEALGYFEQIDTAEENGQWTNVLAESTEENIARIRHYQAATMDLDVAIGRLLEELENKNLLEDTLIVLYGDHNVYYHELYLEINAGSDTEYYNMEMYHTFFCMYNPILTDAYLESSQAESTYINDFVSPYNIVPTVLDLLGVPYHTNLYLGESVFSENVQIFYSNKLTGIFNDAFYSDDGTSITYYRDITSATEESIDAFLNQCETFISKIAYINLWYLSFATEKEQPPAE